MYVIYRFNELMAQSVEAKVLCLCCMKHHNISSTASTCYFYLYYVTRTALFALSFSRWTKGKVKCPLVYNNFNLIMIILIWLKVWPVRWTLVKQKNKTWRDYVWTIYNSKTHSFISKLYVYEQMNLSGDFCIKTISELYPTKINVTV